VAYLQVVKIGVAHLNKSYMHLFHAEARSLPLDFATTTKKTYDILLDLVEFLFQYIPTTQTILIINHVKVTGVKEG
jgi:hypothetical protein